MEVQSKTFEQMVDDFVLGSTTPSSLSLDLKKTEMVTADLIALVHMSDLKSRQSLSDALSEFVTTARSAGRALARLDAKMNGAMDNVMAMNDYALHAIEEAKANEGVGFARFLALWRSSKTVEEVVKESFLNAMNILSESLERMILEAEVNRQNLDALEEKLNTVHRIALRENATVNADREELLSYLWTQLGGNRKDLKNFDRNLEMLGALTNHRKAAQARVIAMLHVLQGVSQDMEDMRERVAAPNLAGSKVTTEIHMRSIRNGLERMTQGRRRVRGVGEEARWKTLSAAPWTVFE